MKFSEIIVKQAKEYFDQNPTHKTTLQKLINGERPNGASLRVVDFYIVRYVKNVSVYTKDGSSAAFAYQTKLIAFGKRYFDCFRRRFPVNYDGLDTTVGQLNFFHWFFLEGLWESLIHNLEDIKNHMSHIYTKGSTWSSSSFPSSSSSSSTSSLSMSLSW